jgi:hypothetical protein
VNTVILNWQRPLWEGDQEVVKSPGRDEPIWIVIHKCMEATLGICLYSCLYLKLAKMLSFLLSPMFCLQQNRRTRGWKQGFRGSGEVAQSMYTHISKCKKIYIHIFKKRLIQKRKMKHKTYK